MCVPTVVTKYCTTSVFLFLPFYVTNSILFNTQSRRGCTLWSSSTRHNVINLNTQLHIRLSHFVNLISLCVRRTRFGNVLGKKKKKKKKEKNNKKNNVVGLNNEKVYLSLAKIIF